MRNIALILLGGVGKRVGYPTPKQFIKKNDIPIYIYAIKNYQEVELITDIVLVTHSDYLLEVKEDIKRYHLDKVRDVIIGGKERFISSYLGISRCTELFNEEDNILIADAVRPNTSRQLILANIFALTEAKAVLTAIRGPELDIRKDTCHMVGRLSFLAQTPQSFKLGYIFDTYNKFINNDDFFPFDDIQVVELAKERFVLVEGEDNNYKITDINDLERFLNN